MTNVLLNHEGQVGSSEDRFSHSLTVVTGATDLSAIAADARDALVSALNDATDPLLPVVASTFAWQNVRAAEILDLLLGTLSASASAAIEPEDPGTGGATPAAVALAISLTAGVRPNGTPLRGRFYLPSLSSASVSTEGTYLQARIDDAVAFMDNWFAALNTAGLSPHVWSRTLAVVQPVTAGRIGNVPDTIRSRRNNTPESYTAFTV